MDSFQKTEPSIRDNEYQSMAKRLYFLRNKRPVSIEEQKEINTLNGFLREEDEKTGQGSDRCMYGNYVG
jgi:hypothetical protein